MGIDTKFTRVNSTKLRSPSTAEADIILNDILNNVDTIHLFMIHLSNEYSIECLLSFIEFWQYIEYLKVNIRNKLETKEITDNDDKPYIALTVELPDTLVQSKIVTNLDTDYKRKAYDLYTKYIVIGCAYEINISGHLRQKFIDL